MSLAMQDPLLARQSIVAGAWQKRGKTSADATMTKTLSTLTGFAAILTWSFLAFLSTAAGPVPPFQLAAMTFCLGGTVGAGSWLFRPQAVRALRQPWPVWALGVAGLCIYHCAYFFAIQSAPPVEVSLIAYLWPLLIVVFAAFLPGERLRLHHLAGVMLGLAGAVIVITRGGAVGLAGGIRPGHLIALFCAFVWSAYSVLSRRFGAVPTDVVAGYCLITAAVALVLHLGLETTVVPQTAGQWAAIVVLGTIPLGAGFYAWDRGCKHGDIMVLGALSYAAPLFSVIVLLAAGYGACHWSVAAACALIVAGALIAAKDMLSRRPDATDGLRPEVA
jgi:drug/metabolite transporter (DMT)-like permease